MGVLPDIVQRVDLDHVEILRRGGANLGNEYFALCKCPVCGHIYLIELEVDTLYISAEDLKQRVLIFGVDFSCVACGSAFPAGPWIGIKAPESMQVTWQDLSESPWRWVTERTRGSG
jgi:hypothetical protein